MGRLLYSPMDDRRVPKLARPARSVTRATTAAKHPLPPSWPEALRREA